MEDLALNRNLEDTRELQTRWSQFHDFALMAIKNKAVNAQAELKFLELKSRIAMLHDGFMAGLKHSQKTGQNVMQIVGDSILLKRVANYSDAEKQKFEFDWNEWYILINEQISTLEEEQKKLAATSGRAYKANKAKELWKARVYNLFHGAGLKYTVITVAIVLVAYVIPTYVYSYAEFGKMAWSRPVYIPLTRYIFRPYLFPDLDFQTMDEVPKMENWVKEKKIDRTTQGDASKLTADNFKNQVLLEIGATPATLPNFQQLFDKRREFNSELWTADGKQARFFFIFFPDGADAKKFVQACHDGVATYPADRKATIAKEIYMAREANFVMIGISEHQMSGGYIKEKYYLDKNPPSALN